MSRKHPGNDFKKSHWRNVDESADDMLAGKLFQIPGPTTQPGKLVLAERRDQRPGRSVMRLNGQPSKVYCGVSPCKILYGVGWSSFMTIWDDEE